MLIPILVLSILPILKILILVFYHQKNKELLAQILNKEHTLIENVVVNVEKNGLLGFKMVHYTVDLYLLEGNVVMFLFAKIFKKYYGYSLQFSFLENDEKLPKISEFYNKIKLKSSSYRIQLILSPLENEERIQFYDMNLGGRKLNIPELLKKYNLPLYHTPKK